MSEDGRKDDLLKTSSELEKSMVIFWRRVNNSFPYPDLIPDFEWMHTAAHYFQLGFMALNRAILNPKSLWDEIIEGDFNDKRGDNKTYCANPDCDICETEINS